MNRLAAAPVVLIATLLLSVGIAGPSSAHTSLIGVTPEEGSTVAAGDAVTLAFSADLLAIGAEAKVKDSAGVETTLEVTFPTASSAQCVLPAVAAGDLTVAWRVVANDGHPIEGTLAYVADAPAPAAPTSAAPTQDQTVSPAATSSAAATPDAPSPSAPASAVDERPSGFNNVALWAAIFAAILASSVAIIAAKRRR
ncbi:MAG: copper resistance protein CopC [Demequinaceae bacterium]|nr:copper resistance protein CopC [Demequinaceae bacterium]